MTTEFSVSVTVPESANQATQRAAQALADAESYTIETPEGYEAAAGELQAIKAKYRELDDARKELKKPIDEAGKRVQAFFRDPLDFLSRAERTIKRKMADFHQAQERKRLEDQRKADEAARKERERLAERARKAEESGKGERAEQLQKQAETVTAPVVSRPTPKVSGVAMREKWCFEVVDPSKVPDQYKTVDEKKIGGVVRALKGDTDIAGVRVWREETVAARSA